MNNDNALRSLIAKQAARQQAEAKQQAQAKRIKARSKTNVAAMHSMFKGMDPAKLASHG